MLGDTYITCLVLASLQCGIKLNLCSLRQFEVVRVVIMGSDACIVVLMFRGFCCMWQITKILVFFYRVTWVTFRNIYPGINISGPG